MLDTINIYIYIYIYIYLKKISYSWFKLISCSYTCREQILYRKRCLCVKRQKATTSKSRFFIASKGGLPLDIWPSRIAIKCLWQNIYLMLDLLYHEHNPFFMTVVGGSIFKKIFKIIIWEKNIVEGITFTQLLQWWNYN